MNGTCGRCQTPTNGTPYCPKCKAEHDRETAIFGNPGKPA